MTRPAAVYSGSITGFWPSPSNFRTSPPRKVRKDWPVNRKNLTDLDDLKLGEALPATAFLDREGRIVARVLGQITKEELRERLEWLTGKRQGPPPDPLVRHVESK